MRQIFKYFENFYLALTPIKSFELMVLSQLYKVVDANNKLKEFIIK